MPTIEYIYNAKVLSAYDGDTVTVEIDLGFNASIKTPVRLLRINCPELKDPGGKEARDYIRGRLPEGTFVKIRTFKSRNDKYGRWLGEIWLDEICINDEMVSCGHAEYKDY